MIMVEPVSGTVGAVVRGVDLSERLGEARWPESGRHSWHTMCCSSMTRT